MLIYSKKIINTTKRNTIKRIKEIEMILKKIVKTGVKKKRSLHRTLYKRKY